MNACKVNNQQLVDRLLPKAKVLLRQVPNVLYQILFIIFNSEFGVYIIFILFLKNWFRKENLWKKQYD